MPSVAFSKILYFSSAPPERRFHEAALGYVMSIDGKPLYFPLSVRDGMEFHLKELSVQDGLGSRLSARTPHLIHHGLVDKTRLAARSRIDGFSR